MYKLPTGRARVRVLYEEYVHLPWLRRIWESPVTEAPVLEPLFAAAFHGIELCWLLLAEFINDSRTYISKRPRVERVAEDIALQCKLLTEIIDAELEEESPAASRLSLTQSFPFDGCPPTTSDPAISPGLQRLTDAIVNCLKDSHVSMVERNSLIKLVLNLSSAFQSFQRWSVGLGIENQLDELRSAVGLPGLYQRGQMHVTFLDYHSLVRPDIVERTLTDEVYLNPEDFFFRSIHLGTDCWAFVALSQLQSAKECALKNEWHLAAARALQAARIFHYLGDHVMLLTTMNLRDYLGLKVELEGTSGEGSDQVKSFKRSVRALAEPLWCYLLSSSSTNDLEVALLQLYNNPVEHPGVYNFCKALEDVESGLLGGFYYKHYCLATNVIGSEARGTMSRAVAALKGTYETAIFPQLDAARVKLGVQFDEALASRKGRIMNDILTRLSSSKGHSACPFSVRPVSPLSKADINEFETIRRDIYSWRGVPDSLRHKVISGASREAHEQGLTLRPGGQPPLAFLDHAWGGMSPQALHRALERCASLYFLGNPCWDVVFGGEIPKAAAHVKALLGLHGRDDITVQFGHNSHELVWRLLSNKLVGNSDVLHVLCSDTEFYSLTRQLNRLSEVGKIKVTSVPSEPVSSFQERLLKEASAKEYDVIYISQITFLKQQTLISDVGRFAQQLNEMTRGRSHIMIDGYHGFMALHTDLSVAADKVIYLAGMLKHAACGPNVSFAIVPRSLNPHPVLTGWLADPTVLGAGAPRVEIGHKVGYLPEMALQGGTPAYVLPLLLFNSLMDLWQTGLRTDVGVDLVKRLHGHVMQLQDYFLMRLERRSDEDLNAMTLVKQTEHKGLRSHTLCFAMPKGPQQAAEVVQRLANKGVIVDSRGDYVRIGFGANHSTSDVDVLLSALE